MLNHARPSDLVKVGQLLRLLFQLLPLPNFALRAQVAMSALLAVLATALFPKPQRRASRILGWWFCTNGIDGLKENYKSSSNLESIYNMWYCRLLKQQNINWWLFVWKIIAAQYTIWYLSKLFGLASIINSQTMSQSLQYQRGTWHHHV